MVEDGGVSESLNMYLDSAESAPLLMPKPAEKKPALSELNENTLVHYASSDPYKGSNNTLHISSDCPKLANAWAIFQQPLFEVKMQRDRRWKLCPHCANAEPMLFVPKKRHWLFSPSINLKIINKWK